MIEAIVVCGLAGWRLASLLVDEDGPWAIFARLRHQAGADAPEVHGLVAEILTCVWCASIWTTTAMLLLWIAAPWLVAAPAAWGVAVLASRAVR